MSILSGNGGLFSCSMNQAATYCSRYQRLL